MKAISPLIATVLLIAFTVSIAGLINIWLTGFTRTSTGIIGSEAETKITCSYGALNLKSLRFNSSTSALTGYVENTGTITLGNVTLQILYDNATVQKLPLCLSGSTTINCSVSNLSLTQGTVASFSVAVSSNYDKIKATSNCTEAYDEASRSEVS